jgi:hypothetical protein
MRNRSDDAATRSTNMAKPVTGTRTRKAADTAGPKPGSSRSNQTAKISPEEPTVKEIKSANRGNSTIAVLSNGKIEVIDHLYKVGVQIKEGDTWKSVLSQYALKTNELKVRDGGKLANGLNGRNAPHSSKAVQDNGRAAKKPAEPKPAPKAQKTAERKAARAERAAPKADDNRKITIVDKKFTYGAEGTARRNCWDVCKASKTVAEYVQKGGKAKYLPRWVQAGAIKLG